MFDNSSADIINNKYSFQTRYYSFIYFLKSESISRIHCLRSDLELAGPGNTSHALGKL